MWLKVDMLCHTWEAHTYTRVTDRVIHALTPLAPVNFDHFDDEDEIYDDDSEIDDYEIVDDEEALNKLYAGIPQWRRPSKNLDFSSIKPDGRCPCGSGRKHNNCHGVKQKKN